MADDHPLGAGERSPPEPRHSFVPLAPLAGRPPAKDGRPRPTPDYQAFYSSQKPMAAALLAATVPEDDIAYAFSPRWAHYFVLGNFQHFNGNVDRIFLALRDALAPPSNPSRDCVGALHRCEALSMFEILRLHLAFEYVRTSSKHTEISRQIHRDPDRPLIGNGSVLPSLRYVNPERLRRYRSDAGLKEKDVLRLAGEFLCVQLPRVLLSEFLELGEIRGNDQRRPYRITDTLAIGLSAAFAETQDLGTLRAEANALFPADPRLGEGNGQYTTTLGRSQGNQIRLLEDQ